MYQSERFTYYQQFCEFRSTIPINSNYKQHDVSRAQKNNIRAKHIQQGSKVTKKIKLSVISFDFWVLKLKKNYTFEASINLKKSMKKVIFTDKAPKAIGPYSQAIEINGMLFISGQIPIDPVTSKVIEGGIKEQTEQVMKNIGAILSEAGYTFDDVVKSTCLLSDMDNFAAMNEVYGKYYPEKSPARAAYSVVKLPLGVLVEIETIAGR